MIIRAVDRSEAQTRRGSQISNDVRRTRQPWILIDEGGEGFRFYLHRQWMNEQAETSFRA
jgi:hypothetical protein